MVAVTESDALKGMIESTNKIVSTFQDGGMLADAIKSLNAAPRVADAFNSFEAVSTAQALHDRNLSSLARKAYERKGITMPH